MTGIMPNGQKSFGLFLQLTTERTDAHRLTPKASYDIASFGN